MRQRKEVLTTGEAARVLGVAPRTVSKWMAGGEFPNAYRLPPSRPTDPRTNRVLSEGERRIPINDVQAFASRYNIPLSPEWGFEQKLILVSAPESFPPPDTGSHIEVIRQSFVAAAVTIGKAGWVSQLVIWTGFDGKLAGEVAALAPKWYPPPLVVVGDDGFVPTGLPDRVLFARESEIPWASLFNALGKYVGVREMVPYHPANAEPATLPR